MNCQAFLTVNQRLSNSVQVVGDDAPADPTLHALVAMVATALQPVPAFQPADASFDASPPVTPAPEPPLALIRLPRCGLMSGLRQYYAAHAVLLSDMLIRCCRHLAIGHQ